jgi:hypothetical protein
LIINNQQKGNKKQNGLALLVLVVALLLTISVYYFSKISIIEIKADKLQKTRIALTSAKKALIGYATLRSDLTSPSLQHAKYGYLPCPANNNGDGNSVGACGDANKSTIGWFPWRSLGMAPLKDSNGDCLLYAVSSTYKYKPEAGMLNEDTNFGMFQVVDENDNVIYGSTAQDRIVAIVFSAGTALAGQSRIKNPDTECGDDVDNFGAYLDTFEVSPGDTVDNSDVKNGGADENKIDRFVQVTSAGNEGVFNDQFVVITRDEIWPKAIAHRTSAFDISDMTGGSKVRRLTKALARCLASYANDNDNSGLPFPAPLNVNGGDYRDNTNYADIIVSALHVGRYPFITEFADSVVPGAINNVVENNELFKKVFNGPIEPTPPQPIVPPTTYIWQCNALFIDSPVGSYADLRTSTSEERRFWNNWKDHIIYVVSERYTPRAIPVDDLIQPRCNDGSSTNDGCIIFNGNTYAAIVMYSNRKLDIPGLIREAPIANIDTAIVDTKQVISNYIEVINAAGNGKGDYSPDVGSNDLFFCLTDTEPVDVIECI